MEIFNRNKTLKLFVSAGIIVVAAALTYNIASHLDEPSQNIPNNKKTTAQDTVIDDIDSNLTPKPNKSVAHLICEGDNLLSDLFVLKSSALVYNTAQGAKSKTNPVNTYEAREYAVFRCFDGMANITRSPGYPGGWIDPKDPYNGMPAGNSGNSASNELLSTNIMSLDNAVVNWSHEYPTSFVKDYDGHWNLSADKLYLTFDCGYDYNNLASKIMDTLKNKGIKAVFFVTGDFMADRPDLIKRMSAEGHIVGNHSFSHLNQPQNLNSSIDIVKSDVETWEKEYQKITGSNSRMKYFRPPSGAISKRSLGLMQQLGYKTLLWGAAYKDWDTANQPSKEEAMNLLRRYTSAGDIVLLHGVSQSSTDILSQYIDEYISKGFEFSLP